MNRKSVVTMSFPEEGKSQKQFIPSIRKLGRKLVDVDKKAILKSLNGLISDVTEILDNLSTDNPKVKLDEVSIGVEFTTEGGIAWVASVTAGTSSSMTLTFKVDANENKKNLTRI
jgi:hypothetical protein